MNYTITVSLELQCNVLDFSENKPVFMPCFFLCLYEAWGASVLVQFQPCCTKYWKEAQTSFRTVKGIIKKLLLCRSIF